MQVVRYFEIETIVKWWMACGLDIGRWSNIISTVLDGALKVIFLFKIAAVSSCNQFKGTVLNFSRSLFGLTFYENGSQKFVFKKKQDIPKALWHIRSKGDRHNGWRIVPLRWWIFWANNTNFDKWPKWTTECSARLFRFWAGEKRVYIRKYLVNSDQTYLR